ncbi:choice-of-anchor M domain-containing protein [Microbacterium sp. SLBN-146]|uniref:choice-of-anchor M domain-containing protein n=1 Tax=Microbacterium sp. SLBN-146 TaxID=2768457 RepID=UPI00114D81EE|nr:choice-of-anchor M domain-containing protein [Microbacterium sp. SLBN-146]TQJ31075.1 surface-anchored protein [Microbacterium sp. SLBN-146]
MTETKALMRRQLPFRRIAATTLLALALAAVTPVSDLDQDIDDDQQDATGQAVISEGHVDLGLLHRDGQWQLRLHDDSAEPPVWRSGDDVVLAVTDAAARDVPTEGFEFLDLTPGERAYVVPQTEAPGVVWVGWNTQDPGVLEAVDRGVTLRVTGITGPGAVTVFLQSGSFGEPDVLFSSREAYPQEAWIELNTHTHANWVFGEPGAYLVDVAFAATTIAGEEVVASGSLRFAVGEGTAPDEAFALTSSVHSPAADATPESDAEQQTDAAPWPWIIAGGITVVLAVGVVVGSVASRRARRAARSETPRTEHGA